jgi:ferredoxin-NADP reductase
MTMKLSDFKGIRNKSVATVASVSNPYGDYHTIQLKPAENTKWRPGEHGIFKLPGKRVEGKKWRAFSVASIPEEGVMMIGTRTGQMPSSFKQALIRLKKGDKVSVRGPFGWFTLQDETSPLVLIASGVGITPIRALLKTLENDTGRDVHVVYASRDFHLFGDEIDAMAEHNDRIKLAKTVSANATAEKVDALVSELGAKAYYYVSGSRKAIKSIKARIKGGGVEGKRIINDPFFGY